MAGLPGGTSIRSRYRTPEVGVAGLDPRSCGSSSPRWKLSDRPESSSGETIDRGLGVIEFLWSKQSHLPVQDRCLRAGNSSPYCPLNPYFAKPRGPSPFSSKFALLGYPRSGVDDKVLDRTSNNGADRTWPPMAVWIYRCPQRHGVVWYWRIGLSNGVEQLPTRPTFSRSSRAGLFGSEKVSARELEHFVYGHRSEPQCRSRGRKH